LRWDVQSLSRTTLLMWVCTRLSTPVLPLAVIQGAWVSLTSTLGSKIQPQWQTVAPNPPLMERLNRVWIRARLPNARRRMLRPNATISTTAQTTPAPMESV